MHELRRVCVIGGKLELRRKYLKQVEFIGEYLWICLAGTAGLSALKNSLQAGLEAVAYERGAEIGGTWIFSEELPKDEHEEVHSSMYEGLR